MAPTLTVRLGMAVAAIAVAVGLASLERDHEGCQQAMQRAFLASNTPAAELSRAVEPLAGDCSGGEPLARIAAGLRDSHPRIAARLARVAAAREPDGYTAWAVLALTEPPARARAAAARRDALNPIAAHGAGP